MKIIIPWVAAITVGVAFVALFVWLTWDFVEPPVGVFQTAWALLTGVVSIAAYIGADSCLKRWWR